MRTIIAAAAAAAALPRNDLRETWVFRATHDHIAGSEAQQQHAVFSMYL
jgi:hypothetical protein